MVTKIWEEIQLYVSANEQLRISRKTTPNGKLYEKVHETDVKEAMKQRNVSLPSEITVQKNTREEVGEHQAKILYNGK